MDLTILHVEDDRVVSLLVAGSLKTFGFTGTIIPAKLVSKALSLLDAPHPGRIDLIIVAMKLPDGTGLDVVRKVRSDPSRRLTPVIFLSGDINPETIKEAYAAGANCYFPKSTKPILESLRSLYDCWVQTAFLPVTDTESRIEGILNKSINIRARASEVYLRFAELSASRPEESRFWLERSLVSGNFANLMALFRHRIKENYFAAGTLQRISEMQSAVEEALVLVEQRMKSNAADTKTVCGWASDLADAVDENVFTEWIECLNPKAAAVTKAMKERGIAYLEKLGDFILDRTEEPELRQRGKNFLQRADRMKVAQQSCFIA